MQLFDLDKEVTATTTTKEAEETPQRSNIAIGFLALFAFVLFIEIYFNLFEEEKQHATVIKEL